MTPLGGAPTVRRNLIHDVAGDVPFFTDMALVMRSLGHPASAYDWLITDIDFIAHGRTNAFHYEPMFVTGPELRWPAR